ncbi:unnamed protein product [Moneuplotes crassus]|uniref:Uncharacterized protein n=1 Tax=Euplotes crassus TaxID=5936 RepID=A0AAD1X8D2_EUPCR|nr:unnamed protein product [Moneuplotes crassus]
MKPCFTKLCTAQRQVFCQDHKAILCYGCKDKLHTKCQVDEIVDPDRVQANITHLDRVLETMGGDQTNFNIGMHIRDMEEFIHTQKSKIASIQTKFDESFKQDRFLEYKTLLEEVLGVSTEIKENEVFQEYCSFLVNFNVAHKLDLDQETKQDEVFADAEKSQTCENSLETTQAYLDEFANKEDLEKLYERVMECDLQSKKLEELKIDLSIDKEIEMMDEILKSNTEIKNLEKLTLTNCDKNIENVIKFLNLPLFSNIKTLKLDCDEKCSWLYCKIKPVLPALASAVESMNIKEVNLEVWKFEANDLANFINTCSTCEVISIKSTNFGITNQSLFEKAAKSHIKTLKLSGYGNRSFLPGNDESILKIIQGSALKDSLQEIQLGKFCSQRSFQMALRMTRMGLGHIKVTAISD